MKCWMCKRTKEEVIADLMQLEKEQTPDGKVNSKEAMDSEEWIELIKDEYEDGTFVDFPVCRICQGIISSTMKVITEQCVTGDELEDKLKNIKLVVEE